MSKLFSLFKVKNHNFIERSLMGALLFFKDSVFAEEIALRQGFLQTIDPRIKAVTIFLFLGTAIFARDFFALLILYLLSLFLAYCSNIGLSFFLKRTLIFIPLFSFFISFPAIFSPFTPGEAWISLKLWGRVTISITKPGLASAGLFLVRVTTAVSLVVLLSLTTRHFELLRVLQVFRIPRIFIMTIGMCYRYLYLLVEMIENTYCAIKSRVGTRIHYKKGQKLVAWNIASFWRRSYSLNEQVYNAMISRGYTGDVYLLNSWKVKFKDWLWLSGTLIIIFFLITFGVKK
ncbi:MAG: cobalt ECF transporter T component CbiQ [Desulfobacterota bacterium]|nr:cobalt ECF transporter T component CbiQ [Thermodesulfobacteriota bacterium]